MIKLNTIPPDYFIQLPKDAIKIFAFVKKPDGQLEGLAYYESEPSVLLYAINIVELPGTFSFRTHVLSLLESGEKSISTLHSFDVKEWEKSGTTNAKYGFHDVPCTIRKSE